jgi:hypothetical protein
LLFCFATPLSITVVAAMTGYIVNQFPLTLKDIFRGYTVDCE